jgi:hypothetical protein
LIAQDCSAEFFFIVYDGGLIVRSFKAVIAVAAIASSMLVVSWVGLALLGF